MDLSRLLMELRDERAKIEEAIIVLERLGGARRGRKPGWMNRPDGEEVEETEPAGAPKKRRFSPEARKRMAEAQKRRWAAARAATD